MSIFTPATTDNPTTAGTPATLRRWSWWQFSSFDRFSLIESLKGRTHKVGGDNFTLQCMVVVPYNWTEDSLVRRFFLSHWTETVKILMMEFQWRPSWREWRYPAMCIAQLAGRRIETESKKGVLGFPHKSDHSWLFLSLSQIKIKTRK